MRVNANHCEGPGTFNPQGLPAQLIQRSNGAPSRSVLGCPIYHSKVARSTYSISNRLAAQSREAALAGIQVFNNPLINFKSETFIVLEMIAWTYLLHGYYRKEHVEYWYFRMKDNRRVVDRFENGQIKYWDLTHCL